MPRPTDVGVGTAAVLTRMRASVPGGSLRQQVLLGRRRGAHGAGLWGFSGGWIDRGDTSLEESLAREVLEETGIVVDSADSRLLCVTTEPHDEFRTVTIFYAVPCPLDFGEEPPRPLEPHKCDEWRWFFVDEPPAGLFGSVRTVLQRIVKQSSQVPEYLPSNVKGIVCLCGGYAKRVRCTVDEIRQYGCGGGGFECCVRAFVCRVCNTRIAGIAESPE